MHLRNRKSFFLLFVLFMSGCEERLAPAPVEELKWRPYSAQQKIYAVKKGDTLYAVAFKFDKDYHELALVNHLQKPYSLNIGQKILLQSSRNNTGKNKTQPRKVNRFANKPIKTKWSSRNKIIGASWVWPIKGRLVSTFTPNKGKKGINIAGKKGDKIHAASSGIVAYSGNGLSGYGNLIIIKHQGDFLTAYANNAKNLVQEGASIKAGQVIADMGLINRTYWGVHFEIRKRGKPVNPLNYLEKG